MIARVGCTTVYIAVSSAKGLLLRDEGGEKLGTQEMF
jgi:hypothetical protein